MSRPVAIESLEARTFLSSASFNYANFENARNLIANGYGSEAVTSGGELHLTSNQFQQARSVWYRNPVPIEKFETTFTFRANPNTLGADGFTFALLNGPKTAVGSRGRDLGFGNIPWHSEAVAFNQYNYNAFGSKFGFASDGELPATTIDLKPIDLHSGHLFRATVSYDGSVLSVVVVDTVGDRGGVFRASRRIDLVEALGTSRAIIGFTASTGVHRSYQDIASWDFSGSMADPPPQPAPVPIPRGGPTIAATARIGAYPVSTRTGTLSALGQDAIDAEGDLTYTWRVMSMPSGARRPTFTENGTNAAKATSTYFYKDGAYRFRVTVTNTAGLSAISEVKASVVQNATAVAIAPHRVEVRAGKRVQYSAVLLDQFKKPMRTQPTFRYDLLEGDGIINRRTGLFTAGETEGHAVVSASGGGVIGTAGLTVLPDEVTPDVGAGA